MPTVQIPVPLDTPDAAGNGYAAYTTNNGFVNVRRVLPGFQKTLDSTWEGAVRIPQNYASGGILIASFVCNATTGAIRTQISDSVVAAGVSEDTAYTAETAATTTVPGTAKFRFDVSTTLTTTLLAGSTLNAKVARIGTNGADTLAVDLLLWELILSYTSS